MVKTIGNLIGKCLLLWEIIFLKKRMVITRLANQGNFEKVMQKSYEQIDKWLIENNQPPI